MLVQRSRKPYYHIDSADKYDAEIHDDDIINLVPGCDLVGSHGNDGILHLQVKEWERWIGYKVLDVRHVMGSTAVLDDGMLTHTLVLRVTPYHDSGARFGRAVYEWAINLPDTSVERAREQGWY